MRVRSVVGFNGTCVLAAGHTYPEHAGWESERVAGEHDASVQ